MLRTTSVKLLKKDAFRFSPSMSVRSAQQSPSIQLIPDNWSGHRGNFAPKDADDQYLVAPLCGETLFTSPKGLINLDTGAPCDWWLKQAKKLFARGVGQWEQNHRSHFSMQYGPTHGQAAFRASLAQFLSRRYGEAVDQNGLFQTSGATHGFSQSLTAFFGRVPLDKRMLFMESPTYFLAPKIAEEHGFNIQPVPVSSTGLDLDVLEESVAAAASKGLLANCSASRFAGVVYCIPTHHNPTGALMPHENRERLLDLAQRYNLLVFSDDVYELLSYSNSEIPDRLVAYDSTKNGHVIGNGSFSKILSPGVRTGWIEARQGLVDHLASSATVCSSGASSQLTSAVISELMKTEQLDDFVDLIQLELGVRMDAVQDHFKRCAPPGCTLRPSNGGMCTWLEMPKEFDSHDVLVDARRVGVSFKPGDLFTAHDSAGHARNCCRIVVPHYNVSTLTSGIEKLCGVLWQHHRRLTQA